MPSIDFDQRLRDRLLRIAERGGLRRLPGTPLAIDFCSNDYLGLARDLPAVSTRGGGSTGSRLISGDRDEYREIERRIAEFHGAEAALVFPSGYAANTGLLSCLPQRGDTIFYDELIHASLRDGLRLSPARAYAFRHNDTDHLAQRLAKADGPVFIVVESIYSMDGDLGLLRAFADLADTFRAALIVDEAHATGVYGSVGNGLVPEMALTHRVFARTITFGKGLGSHGAAVLGSEALRDYLVNFSRPFIYTTGPAPHQWQHLAAAYELLRTEYADRRARLETIIRYFRQRGEGELGTQLLPAAGPIQGVIVPGNEAAVAAERTVQDKGMAVKAIRHPTVKEGAERLRICLHSFNSEQEIDRLIATLRSVRQV